MCYRDLTNSLVNLYTLVDVFISFVFLSFSEAICEISCWKYSASPILPALILDNSDLEDFIDVYLDLKERTL